MLLDEHAVAACWAWEQDYVGMQIAGTIHNEIRLDAFPEPVGDAQIGSISRVAQHEPSGGGRSIPQHVRTAVRDSRLARRARPAAHRGDGSPYSGSAQPR